MIESDFRVEPADYTIDFSDLRKVREPVFVVEQQVPIEEEWDDLDPSCYHVLARDNDNQPIGTGRLTPEHKIGRMAVMKDWRGKGVGDALMRALMDEAQRRGWSSVSLNAQVQAQPFYARHGFEPYGERFMEAGIEHQAMRRSLPPPAATDRPAAAPRAASEPVLAVEELDAVAAASERLIDAARREVWLYTRDLEHSLYGRPAVVDALRRYGTSGRGGVVHVLIQEPAAAAGSGHPLLELAQRLPSVFLFRTPVDPVDQQFAGAYLVNDRDGFLFRQLGSRFDGEWSPTQPARAKQLREQFMRVWERSRACSELRSLGI